MSGSDSPGPIRVDWRPFAVCYFGCGFAAWCSLAETRFFAIPALLCGSWSCGLVVPWSLRRLRLELAAAEIRADAVVAAGGIQIQAEQAAGVLPEPTPAANPATPTLSQPLTTQRTLSRRTRRSRGTFRVSDGGPRILNLECECKPAVHCTRSVRFHR